MKFSPRQLERLSTLGYKLNLVENQVYADDGYGDSLISIHDDGAIRYDYVPHDYPENAEYCEYDNFAKLAKALDI